MAGYGCTSAGVVRLGAQKRRAPKPAVTVCAVDWLLCGPVYPNEMAMPKNSSVVPGGRWTSAHPVTRHRTIAMAIGSSRSVPPRRSLCFNDICCSTNSPTISPTCDRIGRQICEFNALGQDFGKNLPNDRRSPTAEKRHRRACLGGGASFRLIGRPNLRLSPQVSSRPGNLAAGEVWGGAARPGRQYRDGHSLWGVTRRQSRRVGSTGRQGECGWRNPLCHQAVGDWSERTTRKGTSRDRLERNQPSSTRGCGNVAGRPPVSARGAAQTVARGRTPLVVGQADNLLCGGVRLVPAGRPADAGRRSWCCEFGLLCAGRGSAHSSPRSVPADRARFADA